MVLVLEPVQELEDDFEEDVVSRPDTPRSVSLRHAVSDFLIGLGGMR